MGYPRTLRTLGDHLRARRLDLGLLQKEMAQELEVSKDTVRNWEADRVQPTAWQFPGIVRFLGYLPWGPAEAIADRLVFYRRVNGLSQRRLAEVLGVDPTTVARWEDGRGCPCNRLRRRVDRVIGSC